MLLISSDLNGTFSSVSPRDDVIPRGTKWLFRVTCLDNCQTWVLRIPGSWTSRLEILNLCLNCSYIPLKNVLTPWSNWGPVKLNLWEKILGICLFFSFFVFNNLFVYFLHLFILFLERKEGREREEEKQWCERKTLIGCLWVCTPTRIKSATFWCIEWRSKPLSDLVRAAHLTLKTASWGDTPMVFCYPRRNSGSGS